MDKVFWIIFSAWCAAFVVILVSLFYNNEYANKCKEQGGISVKNICIKAETIKVVY